MGEKVVTYVGGLIALALIVRYGDSVSGIIEQISKSTSMFAGVLLGNR